MKKEKEKEVCIGPYRVGGTNSYLVAIEAINQAVAEGDFSALRQRSVAIGGENCDVSMLPQFRDLDPTIKVRGADGKVREFPRVNFR